jgi:hypothetical protein
VTLFGEHHHRRLWLFCSLVDRSVQMRSADQPLERRPRQSAASARPRKESRHHLTLTLPGPVHSTTHHSRSNAAARVWNDVTCQRFAFKQMRSVHFGEVHLARKDDATATVTPPSVACMFHVVRLKEQQQCLPCLLILVRLLED